MILHMKGVAPGTFMLWYSVYKINGRLFFVYTK